MKKTCNNCLYGGMCDTWKSGNCKFFAPLEEDSDLDRKIEKDRKEFHAAWLIYTKEDD